MFTGLSAFPLTPTDDEGRLNHDLLGQFLERVATAGADSIGLLGSTGGYAYLAPEERKRTLRAAVERVAERTPLIVGVGALRTDVARTSPVTPARPAPTACCSRPCPTSR